MSAFKDWTWLELVENLSIMLDSEDVERVRSVRWLVRIRANGSVKIVANDPSRGNRRKICLARFILQPPAGKVVHLKNRGRTFDYRKSNLTLGSRSTLRFSMGKSDANLTSCYKGVSREILRSGEENWRATIEVNSVSINLGTYKSEFEAASAYDKAAQRLLGDAAFLNLNQEGSRPKESAHR